MKKLVSVMVVGLVLGWSGVAGAGHVDLYTGVSDATIYNGDNTNHGMETSLVLGSWGCQTVIKFDVSSIPAGSTITGASACTVLMRQTARKSFTMSVRPMHPGWKTKSIGLNVPQGLP